MTAVVLAGGRGSRLRASSPDGLASDAQRRAALRGLKIMMPVDAAGRRPLLDYILGSLADAGVSEVVLVVPPEAAEVRDHVARTPPARLAVRFAVQAVADGTAGAVLAAEAAVTDPAFLVMNGDNLYPPSAVRALCALESCGLPAFTRASLLTASGFPPGKIDTFADVTADAAGWLVRLVEKPARGPGAPERSALVSMNIWKLDRTIFEAARDVPPSPRGERELPGAVMLAVTRGTPFRVLAVSEPVLDLTTADDVALVSRALAGVEPRP
ncbi:MAG: sugar phosphate nucleotidyltransferase [Vicinamibacterales bacterium]